MEQKDREDSPAPVNATGKRFLIVDDVDMNREYLRLLLENTGAAVDEACTGDEGVRMFSREKYDMVFMDLHMPVMNGYNATRNIRELPFIWAYTTPIISVSAEDSMELQQKCREVGINDHLIKPVTEEALANIIRKWLPGK